MITRIVAGLWLALALTLAGLALRSLAEERRREDALAALQGYAFVADAGERARLEVQAGDLLAAELATGAPRRAVVAAVWAVARHAPASEAQAQAIAARARALVEAWSLPDVRAEEHLRQADDLVELLADPTIAADLRARILARSGDRAAAAAALSAGAADLAAVAGTPTGDRQLADLARCQAELVVAGSGRSGLTWLARESAPLAGPLEAAADAAYGHLEALLRPYRLKLPRDPSPLQVATAVGEVARVLPDQRQRLRAAWDALGAMQLRERCDRGTLLLYAAATRREQLPLAALAVCIGMAAAVFGGLAFVFRRLGRGRRAVDPAAETVPNVEPIELDTDAITLQRRATSVDTRVD